MSRRLNGAADPPARADGGPGSHRVKVSIVACLATFMAALPGQLLGGAGVGLALPSLTGAATVTLPPSRFAAGTAIVSTARQIAMVLGVAALVAILATTTGDIGPADVRRGWTLVLVVADGVAVDLSECLSVLDRVNIGLVVDAVRRAGAAPRRGALGRAGASCDEPPRIL